MDKVADTIIVVVLIAFVVIGMALGWRARLRRQASLGELAAPPAELGAVALEIDTDYVATTRADLPLERIAVAGLGFPGRATLTVAASGVVLEIDGGRAGFVPIGALRGAGTASWVIDRAVERDGLVFFRWVLGGTEVDSYLRPDDPRRVLAALTTLTPVLSEREHA